MYFKQVDLLGFKSFADKTALRLQPGITAIVGPNGCGKSNILDALRWCLGEQSAKALRGNNMQDVIFNGSENRQALGMAEVSLTFDNADSQLPVDFAEVQVSRRVYRSGESEYLLNKAPCRLKDIQEMFMDTGIGTNAYSLIGQGKISMILSSKPEDRRFLFEEAAGIIRYKSRKRVAMRKLDSAEQNLLRLGDIIAEVERQMRSLKRQVNAAIRYREMTEQLRELDIRAAWLKFSRLSEDITRLKEQFATAQDTYEKVSAETTEFEARYEELGLAKLEVDRVLLARREGVHELDGEMERIEREIALIRQQVDFAKQGQERALKEKADCLERARQLELDLARTDEDTAGLAGEIEQKDAELAERQRDHEEKAQRVAQADEEVEALRARAVETMSSRARTQTELETIAVNIGNVDAQLDALYERQRNENHRRETLTGEVDQARAKQAETQAELDDVGRALADRTQVQEGKSEELRALNERWQDLRERKSSQTARLNSLRELRDAYEGFAVGVRAVMKARQRDLQETRGVIGPVGDLVSTEKKYERAVEAALGGNINNVITEDVDAAKGAIGFLKAKRS